MNNDGKNDDGKNEDGKNEDGKNDDSKNEEEYKWIVISFDIGIKNLAYCMLGWIDSEERYEIINWDVINLIPDLENDYCVGRLKKSDQICGKKATYLSKTNNKTYCSLHARPKELFQIITKRKVAQIGNHELNTLMVTKLDEFPKLLNCDEVMLEHQPSKNPRMKNLSFMLYSYFIIRGFVDKPNSRCKKISHKQINAVKKLSLYDGPEVKCNLKNSYDRNKFFSKEYCRYMISKSAKKKWLDFYDSCKKKDDLADCYLQGAWYLTQRFKPSGIVKKRQSTTVKKKKIPEKKETESVEIIEQVENEEGDSILNLIRSFKKNQNMKKIIFS